MNVDESVLALYIAFALIWTGYLIYALYLTKMRIKLINELGGEGWIRKNN
jgi:hypothetical protein